MTREEAIRLLSGLMFKGKLKEALDVAIKALEQEPTTKNGLGVDAVSREEVLWLVADDNLSMGQVVKGIHALPSVTPQEPKCKDCKWWKDSDGSYRRGCGAESICRINTDKVYQGEGYCYLFEPQENEDKDNKGN